MSRQTVRVKVGGDFACFSRPEMKVERVSYEVMAPSAARGVLDAVMWKPEMRWHILRIEILKPVQFIPLKRNEIQSKIAPRTVTGWIKNPGTYKPQPSGAGSDDATPRNTLALRDVGYIIEAEPIIFNPGRDNTPAKYISMLNRRVEKGQCHITPCLGCREFAAWFEPPSVEDRPIDYSQDIGYMLYDIVFDPEGKQNRPIFFKAKVENGVMITDGNVVLPDEDIRTEVLRCSYRR